MLNFTGAMKVYLAVAPVDLQMSFTGLWSLTVNIPKEDPSTGALAPSTPPPPRSDSFAALTIASTASVVTSACMAFGSLRHLITALRAPVA